MKSPSTKTKRDQGFTLIEAMIYIALLSGLLSSFIPYAYSIHEQDLRLLDQIENSGQ